MMSSDLVCFNPKGFSELMDFAKIIADSGMVPDSYRGKPGDIVVAVMMGNDVRLSPMQSLLHIGVIRGKPCLYGDGFLAVVTGHPSFAGIREWSENANTVEGGHLNPDAVAYCSVKRVLVTGEVQEVIRSFSVDDAKRASLWNPSGRTPWPQYPERMLQMRARSFACRDCFPDALKGIMPKEEVEDYNNRPAGRVPVRHAALDAVMPKPVDSTLPEAVEAEYITCEDPEPEPKKAPGLISLAEVPAKPEPKKSKKPTNKERCQSAVKLYEKDFKVSQQALLEAAEIKTIDKVSNKQISWLVETYKQLKSGALTPAQVFSENCFEDSLPPVPPVPSSGIEDAQL